MMRRHIFSADAFRRRSRVKGKETNMKEDENVALAITGTSPIIKDVKVDYGLEGQKNFLFTLPRAFISIFMAASIQGYPTSNPEAPGIPRIHRTVIVPFSKVKREICAACGKENFIWVVARYDATLLFGVLGSAGAKQYFYACESCTKGFKLTKAEVKELKGKGLIGKYRIPVFEKYGFLIAVFAFVLLVFLLLLLMVTL